MRGRVRGAVAISTLHYVCTKVNLLELLVVSRASVSNMKRLSTVHLDLLLFLSLIRVKYGILTNLQPCVCGVLVRARVCSAARLDSIRAEPGASPAQRDRRGKAENREGQSFDGKLLQYFKN